MGVLYTVASHLCTSRLVISSVLVYACRRTASGRRSVSDRRALLRIYDPIETTCFFSQSQASRHMRWTNAVRGEAEALDLTLYDKPVPLARQPVVGPGGPKLVGRTSQESRSAPTTAMDADGLRHSTAEGCAGPPSSPEQCTIDAMMSYSLPTLSPADVQERSRAQVLPQ